MEEVKKQTEEEIMRECLGEDFFECEVQPEIEEAIKEVIDIDAEVIDVTPEPILLDAPKEEAPKEESSGIDFAKRTKGDDKKPVENPAEEPKKIVIHEKVEEIPQEEETSVEGETVHQADIKMTTTVKDTKADTEEEEEEVLATVQFSEIPSKVFFKKGLTRNLGNFESYRVDVGIEMPCATEDVKKYVLEGGKVVEHRLALEIQKAQRLYGNAGGSVFDRVQPNL